MATIAFLSNTITNPINRVLRQYKCQHFDINTIVQTLNSKITADYLVILLDINYYAKDGFLNNSSFEKLDELKLLLIVFRQNNKAKVILSNISGHFLDINSALSLKQQQKLLILNQKIEVLTVVSDVAILNIYQMVNYVGFKHFYNIKNSFLFQSPWTKEAFINIAYDITEKIHLFNNARKKILVLDADNTLWGGIVGEDGIEGIDIDENYPGIIYRFFQQQLKYLQKSGILLALVSKNNEADVKEVFDNKNTPLKWDDFIVTKVNWLPKSQNIKEISQILNIGLDSMVFLDDNIFEIEEVGTSLSVDSVQISIDNPVENLTIIDNILALKTLSISNEDKQKMTQYQAHNEYIKNQKKCYSIDDYLRSIDMEITMNINNKSQLKRISQLVNKTNQFNLTTKRYSESQVLEIMKNNQVFSFSLIDKFGDLGLIAIVIISNNNIDSFLMSCRVLGRNIEQKILYLISNHLKVVLTASYTKTAKNSQVEYFYDRFATKINDGKNKTYQLTKKINNISYIKEK